jgi:hypothetical protein
MNRFEKFALERMLGIYDFVAANPGCSVMQLCEKFELRASAIRANLHKLRDSEHVIDKPGVRSRWGQLPSAWTITYKDRPDMPPPSKKRGKRAKQIPILQPIKVDDAKRIITRAKQIGMKPDSFALPAAFFHPAAVSA